MIVASEIRCILFYRLLHFFSDFVNIFYELTKNILRGDISNAPQMTLPLFKSPIVQFGKLSLEASIVVFFQRRKS